MLIVLRLFCKMPPAEVGCLSRGVIKQRSATSLSLDPAPFLHAQGGALGEKKGLVSTVCACAGFSTILLKQ